MSSQEQFRLRPAVDQSLPSSIKQKAASGNFANYRAEQGFSIRKDTSHVLCACVIRSRVPLTPISKANSSCAPSPVLEIRICNTRHHMLASIEYDVYSGALIDFHMLSTDIYFTPGLRLRLSPYSEVIRARTIFLHINKNTSRPPGDFMGCVRMKQGNKPRTLGKHRLESTSAYRSWRPTRR